MGLIHVGLGANLGDRVATLRAAVAELGRLGRLAACSSLWETEAVGPPPDYLNAAVALTVDDDLLPMAILDALLAIEAAHGRLRGPVKDAPRTLDLDLLLLGERLVDLPGLVVPHPRLHERAFVLWPLAEIAGAVVHPRLQRRIGELRDGLPRGRRVRRVAEQLPPPT